MHRLVHPALRPRGLPGRVAGLPAAAGGTRCCLAGCASSPPCRRVMPALHLSALSSFPFLPPLSSSTPGASPLQAPAREQGGLAGCEGRHGTGGNVRGSCEDDGGHELPAGVAGCRSCRAAAVKLCARAAAVCSLKCTRRAGAPRRPPAAAPACLPTSPALKCFPPVAVPHELPQGGHQRRDSGAAAGGGWQWRVAGGGGGGGGGWWGGWLVMAGCLVEGGLAVAVGSGGCAVSAWCWCWCLVVAVVVCRVESDACASLRPGWPLLPRPRIQLLFPLTSNTSACCLPSLQL